MSGQFHCVASSLFRGVETIERSKAPFPCALLRNRQRSPRLVPDSASVLMREKLNLC